MQNHLLWENIQWAAVFWVKMPWWWHVSDNNSQSDLNWTNGNTMSNNHSWTAEAYGQFNICEWTIFRQTGYSCRRPHHMSHLLTIGRDFQNKRRKRYLVKQVSIRATSIRWSAQNSAQTPRKYGWILTYITQLVLVYWCGWYLLDIPWPPWATLKSHQMISNRFPELDKWWNVKSMFTQILYWRRLLRYLYFTWEFPFSAIIFSLQFFKQLLYCTVQDYIYLISSCKLLCRLHVASEPE